MHRPGPELDLVRAGNLAEFNFSRPVDRGRFQREYDAMLERIQADGVETILLRELLRDDSDAVGYIDRRPNMTYTRDLAVVFRSGAVLMGPHLKGRWGDPWVLKRAFEMLGVPILGAIEQPAFLEGGGVTLIGEDTAVVSLCDRANEAGTRELRRLVLGREVKHFLEVPLPYGHIHIDGVYMTLDSNLCAIYEPAFDSFPCWLYEAGRTEPRHVMFGEFLAAREIERIPLTLEERDRGHLNLVVTRRSLRAVGFEQAARLGSEMARRGWELATFPSDELFSGRGGAHCMTCPLWVD
jgi:N-dimethylarginine dimethylaminohydrolase